MAFPAPSIILITGIMASGKSTIAQKLAETLLKSVHLRGDLFRRMIINGRARIEPDESGELPEDDVKQLLLRYRLAANAAQTYCEAGFTVVYQDIILGPMLNDVVAMLRPCPLSVIVLCPSPDVVAIRDQTRHKVGYVGWTPDSLDHDLRTNTPRLGLWLDTSMLSIDDTISHILTHAEEAAI